MTASRNDSASALIAEIKHFFSDAELRDVLARYADDIPIRRFGEQRRVVVAYTLGLGQGVAATAPAR